MKRVDLIKAIQEFGCVLLRHGAKHDWYRNPNTGVSQPIPRHRDIKENLARQFRTTSTRHLKGGEVIVGHVIADT